MKKMQKMCFLALVGLMVGTSCEKTPQAPDPLAGCIEGIVIGGDCASYLFVSLPKGQIGSYFRTYDTEYNNVITINNIQIADASVNIKLGASVFFKIDPNQDISKCAQVSLCPLGMPITHPKEAYCIKSISNKSCN